MLQLGRTISLLLRKSDSEKDRRRVLAEFAAWRALQSGLPQPRPSAKTLLLIRLDDIGDYLLFRNQLGCYKQSDRFKDHRIVLLGNDSWQSLFMLLDRQTVDEAVWVNKNRYLTSASYRFDIWGNLRERGFETVIAPSCTRPLLLDDLCMLAAAPLHSSGSVNSNVHACWNEISDRLYGSLYVPSRPLMHEFHFNAEFARWACGMQSPHRRPVIEGEFLPPAPGAYVICFVGASTRSKRWPANRWIEFIELCRRDFPGRIVLAGNGEAEIALARKIRQQTGAESIAGAVDLPELLRWVAGAVAVVTNDTMAAHVGVSLGRPTVIVANGVNYMRFAEYRGAGMEEVTTIYPEVLDRRRTRVGDGPYAYSETVSADIASIRAATVMRGLRTYTC
jgi:ADP-heptose:LPS heptosyltransferase